MAWHGMAWEQVYVSHFWRLRAFVWSVMSAA